LHLLANYPEQRHWLAANPSSIDRAVEEIVRFESPIQNAKRTVVRPITLYGATVPQGARLFLLFGAANRDEQQFSDSEIFDITRQPTSHLGFGGGVHRCIGAPIARLEGQIAISEVLRRWPEYELAGKPQRLTSNVMRGITSLPVSFPNRYGRDAV
jgi:cytochrome P450